MHVLVTTLTILSLLPAPGAFAPSAHPAQSQSATRVAATPAPDAVDGGWPRAYTTQSGARVILYQPQVASWPDQKHMTLFAAVSYQGKDAPMAALGTLKIEADTNVAVDDRLVNFSEFMVTASDFPTLSRDQMQTVVGEIVAAVPREQRVIGLDRVLANVNASEIIPRNNDRVKADPPPIFYSQTPAVLVNLDGAPIWAPIPGADFQFAVNTNWDLFNYPETKSLYLRADRVWLRAPALEGPWTRVDTLPVSFSNLPADDNWKETRAAMPPQQEGVAPKVFVSRMPGELLLLTGPPQYSPVTGTGLLWISNSESDIFRAGPQGTVYTLISGRWFSAPDFNGPWTFATPALPSDFKRIPLDHPRSRVLASVPGTRQALEAVLLSQIPQTARVSKTLEAPMVSYAGNPMFEPIASTTVARAVNTDKDILRVGDSYYMCFQGVWFVASSPSGPWTVTGSVPDEIYQIPISSPAYNVTGVTVESQDDDYVDFAADAAYTGEMVAWGSVVWGTGWYYPPYYSAGDFYPAYFAGYPTYGYGARYNPWTGAYSRGGAVYGPYGGAGFGARYNPRTGTYARGAAAYGPYGSAGAARAYNPRTGTSAATMQRSNVYGNWGTTGVQRGDQWAQTAHVTSNRTGNTTRVATGSGGNVYAGRDGNVYRNQGGSWQKYGSGGWSDMQRPTGTTGTLSPRSADSSTLSQLNTDRSARMDGARRTQDLNRGSFGGGSYRPSGGFGGGGFRGGGGGFRGGGGRRR
jgi:hypothetical protein